MILSITQQGSWDLFFTQLPIITVFLSASGKTLNSLNDRSLPAGTQLLNIALLSQSASIEARPAINRLRLPSLRSSNLNHQRIARCIPLLPIPQRHYGAHSARSLLITNHLQKPRTDAREHGFTLNEQTFFPP